jgi:hypothetical protein
MPNWLNWARKITIARPFTKPSGLTRASGARSGVVTLVQRFGNALNLNVHLHMIVLDGVYTIGKSNKARFHRVKTPNQTELHTLLNRVIQRVVRRLQKEDLLIPDPEQPWLDLDSHDPTFISTDRPVKALTADRDGFSLNAAVPNRARKTWRAGWSNNSQAP